MLSRLGAGRVAPSGAPPGGVRTGCRAHTKLCHQPPPTQAGSLGPSPPRRPRPVLDGSVRPRGDPKGSLTYPVTSRSLSAPCEVGPAVLVWVASLSPPIKTLRTPCAQTPWSPGACAVLSAPFKHTSGSPPGRGEAPRPRRHPCPETVAAPWQRVGRAWQPEEGGRSRERAVSGLFHLQRMPAFSPSKPSQAPGAARLGLLCLLPGAAVALSPTGHLQTGRRLEQTRGL